MPSPNCTITFSAKNALVAGVLAGDEIVLSVALTAFDLTTRTEKVTNTTKSGFRSSSKFYEEDTYSMDVLPTGVVTFEDTSSTPMTTAYMEMFLRSVDNSEQFTITSLDDSNTEIDVKLNGAWRRSRASSADVDLFNYSFNVRKSIQ